VVKRATGRTVQDIITERFIGPLGLTRTTWVQPDHDDWARPYRVVDDAIAPEGTPLLGDGGIAPMGGIWTTVTDLARWVTWLDSAYPARDDIDDGPLCRASRREMQEPQNPMGTVDLPGRIGVNSYGYGLRIRDDEQMGRVIMHSGGLPGYGSNMRWAGGRRFAMIALANVTYAPMAQLTHEAFELLHEHAAFPAVADVEGPLVEQMGRRLFELWQQWDDAAAADLFADNVAPDESFERRRAAVARWRDECGGELVLDRIETESATSGTLHLARPSGDPLTIVFELSPLVPPRIQLVDLDD
jgi:CubicO group peptidase (beta-lactamase class C family)